MEPENRSAFGRSAQGCGGAGGVRGFQDAQMVDDKSRVGVAVDQRRAVVQVAPAQNIDRDVVAD